MLSRMLLAAAVAASVGFGCGRVCTPLASRCVGTRAELCGPRGKSWRLLMDCAKLQPKDKGWRCCCARTGRCRCTTER